MPAAHRCGWRADTTHPVVWGDVTATQGEEAKSGPFADWEYHVTTIEGLIPRDVEQMLTALQNRITELSTTSPVTALRAITRLQDTTPALALAAVRTARAAMVSGRPSAPVLGCTRQSTHERYARHVPD
ncbi:hypothetical protein ACWGNM_17175 [Streptomyces sp. NPDC055796]